jgi:hypothetical protein
VATPASAELVTMACHFTTECFDTAPCTDADYRLAFDHDTAPKLFAPLTIGKPSSRSGLEAGQFSTTVRDDAQSFAALPFYGTGSHFGLHAFGDDTTQRMLTVKDGMARYSIHMLDDGIALFYLGTCAEVTG